MDLIGKLWFSAGSITSTRHAQELMIERSSSNQARLNEQVVVAASAMIYFFARECRRSEGAANNRFQGPEAQRKYLHLKCYSLANYIPVAYDDVSATWQNQCETRRDFICRLLLSKLLEAPKNTIVRSRAPAPAGCDNNEDCDDFLGKYPGLDFDLPGQPLSQGGLRTPSRARRNGKCHDVVMMCQVK